MAAFSFLKDSVKGKAVYLSIRLAFDLHHPRMLTFALSLHLLIYMYICLSLNVSIEPQTSTPRLTSPPSPLPLHNPLSKILIPLLLFLFNHLPDQSSSCAAPCVIATTPRDAESVGGGGWFGVGWTLPSLDLARTLLEALQAWSRVVEGRNGEHADTKSSREKKEALTAVLQGRGGAGLKREESSEMEVGMTTATVTIKREEEPTLTHGSGGGGDGGSSDGGNVHSGSIRPTLDDRQGNHPHQRKREEESTGDQTYRSVALRLGPSERWLLRELVEVVERFVGDVGTREDGGQ